MRLFVAVDIDDVTRRRIERTTDSLRRVMERARSPVRIAWVPPDRLHLTLQFVGEVRDDVGGEIAVCLETPFDQSPFELRFGPLGMFPVTGTPRVVWLGLEQGARELSSLQAAVARRLERIEFRRESRPFAPHLTLGRIKEGGTRADRERIAGARLEPVGGCTIGHVTLYRSRLSPRGPTYMPLASTPLVGPPLSSPERVR
jgi:RNA 2',3'-cyclic 3'-phosphodiesterase